jgi:hypothetical protein
MKFRSLGNGVVEPFRTLVPRELKFNLDMYSRPMINSPCSNTILRKGLAHFMSNNLFQMHMRMSALSGGVDIALSECAC